MKDITVQKEVTIKVWDKGEQIDLEHLGHTYMGELMPTEVHIKEDGSITDMPSLCFVLSSVKGSAYIAQITVEMFWPAIEAVLKMKGIQYKFLGEPRE